MDISKKVRMVMAARNINAANLAKMSGISQSNLSKKLNSNKFSIEDLENIANVLNVRFEIHFVLEDGERI